MSVKITIHNRSPVEIIDIVAKLKSDGWVLGVDFDFAYNQSVWDNMIGEIPRYTEFTFYKEQYATIFALKYVS
jgi:hypothetical protein